MRVMSQEKSKETVADLLEEPPESTEEEHGPMEGTDKQVRILRDALEDLGTTTDELADERDYSALYAELVLRRADRDFVNEHLDVAPDDPDLPVRAEEQRLEPQPTINIDGDELSIRWDTDKLGALAEISSSEYCPQCDEHREVRYLVPEEHIHYLEDKSCGHPERYNGDEPEIVAHIRTTREQIRELWGDS